MKIFELKALTLSTILEISKLILKIDIKRDDLFELKEKDFGNAKNFILDKIAKNCDDIIMIIAYALTNTRKKPSKKLIDFLTDNLTNKELYEVMKAVETKMDYGFFLNFLILVTPINMLEATKKE